MVGPAGIESNPGTKNSKADMLQKGIPLEKLALFKKMELGSNIFFYHRAAGEGAISDTTIDPGNDARWLGWEWDVHCNWRLTSDVVWTMRYGAFMPGSAYDGGDKTCRQFLYTGIIFSF